MDIYLLARFDPPPLSQNINWSGSPYRWKVFCHMGHNIHTAQREGDQSYSIPSQGQRYIEKVFKIWIVVFVVCAFFCYRHIKHALHIFECPSFFFSATFLTTSVACDSPLCWLPLLLRYNIFSIRGFVFHSYLLISTYDPPLINLLVWFLLLVEDMLPWGGTESPRGSGQRVVRGSRVTVG